MDYEVADVLKDDGVNFFEDEVTEWPVCNKNSNMKATQKKEKLMNDLKISSVLKLVSDL